MKLYALRLFGEIGDVPVRDRLFIEAEDYSGALQKAQKFIGDFPNWAEQSPRAINAPCHWALDTVSEDGLNEMSYKLRRDVKFLEQRLAELLAELNATKQELVALENPIR